MYSPNIYFRAENSGYVQPDGLKFQDMYNPTKKIILGWKSGICTARWAEIIRYVQPDKKNIFFQVSMYFHAKASVWLKLLEWKFHCATLTDLSLC